MFYIIELLVYSILQCQVLITKILYIVYYNSLYSIYYKESHISRTKVEPRAAMPRHQVEKGNSSIIIIMTNESKDK